MQPTEFTLTANDGIQLYAQEWRPAQEPHGVVALVHGLGEHCGRYRHLAECLGEQGLALVCFDLRGHGRSPGVRGHTQSYTHIMGDIAALIAAARQRFPDRPVFLYGHSLGGNLVLNFVLRRPPAQGGPDLRGVIATSPGLRTTTPPPAWKTAVGRLLYRLRPALTLDNGLEVAAISRDEAIITAYRADPLVHRRISTQLGLDLLTSGEWALAHAGELRRPLLLVHGRADRICSPQATAEFAAKATGADVTLRFWDAGYHELHNEPDKAEVLDFIVQWILARVEQAD